MTRDQRKYLQERLATATRSKKVEIRDSYNIPPAFKDENQKKAYLDKALKNVKEIVEINGRNYYNIITDKEVEVQKKEEIAEDLINKKISELNKLSHEIVDKIVLGDDVGEVTTLLKKITDFKI